MRVVHRPKLRREPDRIGRVFLLGLHEQRLDGKANPQPRGHVAHLAQCRPLDRVQPVQLVRRPGRH